MNRIIQNSLVFSLDNLILSDSVRKLSRSRSIYLKFVLDSIYKKLDSETTANSLNQIKFPIPSFVDTEYKTLIIQDKVVGNDLYFILNLE